MPSRNRVAEKTGKNFLHTCFPVHPALNKSVTYYWCVEWCGRITNRTHTLDSIPTITLGQHKIIMIKTINSKINDNNKNNNINNNNVLAKTEFIWSWHISHQIKAILAWYKSQPISERVKYIKLINIKFKIYKCNRIIRYR